MQQMQSILAIFKDECDAGAWAAYLNGVSALWSLTANENLEQSIEKLIGRGVDPVLVIVSSRVYPTENPELAARIRWYFPAAEFLLISAAEDPTPPLEQLCADAVRHLEVNQLQGAQDGKGYFREVLQKVVAGEPVTITDRIEVSSAMRSFQLRSSKDKEPLLGTLEDALAGEGDAFEFLRQKAALLADELIENALYGAPKSAQGEKLFKKGESRALLPGERLDFRFSFDGETLAMEMSDNWGTLDPDLVVEYLAKNQAEVGNPEIGGRGLFLIWSFFDHFHISIHPGKKTVVGGDLRLSGDLAPETPRGFHITAHREGGAA